MKMLEADVAPMVDAPGAPVIFADDCVHAGYRAGVVAVTLATIVAGPNEEGSGVAMRRAISAHVRLSPECAVKVMRAIESSLAMIEKSRSAAPVA